MTVQTRIINLLSNSQNGLSVREIVAEIGAQRTYVNKVLSTLILDKESNVAKKRAGKEVIYYLTNITTLMNKKVELFNLREHDVMLQIRDDKRFYEKLSESAISIFEYAFTEMLNNAIEHSRSLEATVKVVIGDNKLKFWIRDFGVGVFRNVMKDKQLPDELTATQELLKGKTTTAAHAHSGEGIFFTSKIADNFQLKSYDYSLLVDNRLSDIFVVRNEDNLVGTEVVFEVDADTNKHVADIFRSFSLDPEEGKFDTTLIHVKLYENGSIYVSRSQAKRILFGLDKYEKIILDFRHIPTVGQAFVDEIFRVYKSDRPDVIIEPINMNPEVKFMINRAGN